MNTQTITSSNQSSGQIHVYTSKCAKRFHSSFVKIPQRRWSLV